MNTPIKRLFICATSVIALASCGGGNDVASGGAGTGVTSASAVAAGTPNSAASNSAAPNSAASTSVTSTKAAMDRVGGNCPPPSTTPACQNLSCLPTPTQFTTNSTASGTLSYKLLLPAGSNPPTTLTLSANFTDLIISNYAAGALIGRMISDTYPGVQFNKDYLYGTLFAQLLQESNGANNYSNVGPRQNWIIQDPVTLAPLMAASQGGPYQINSYPYRLEYYSKDAPPGMAAPMGLGLANYTALQQGLNYSVSLQDSIPNCQAANVAPDSLDSKYFGPLAAAYFQFNDIYRLTELNAYNGMPNFATCLKNLKLPSSAQSGNNILDMILNAAYNAGTSAPITQDFMAICAGMYTAGNPATTQVQSMGNYSLSPTSYIAAAGLGVGSPVPLTPDYLYLYYPRQVRLYLDEIYNQQTFPSSAFTVTSSVNLSVNDVASVFANVFGTLSYVNSAGQYGYIATADSNLAFTKAMTASSLTAQSFLNISNATDRAKFFTLLDTAIQNLQSSLINTNFTGFNAITQTTFLSSASSSPQVNPAIAK